MDILVAVQVEQAEGLGCGCLFLEAGRGERPVSGVFRCGNGVLSWQLLVRKHFK
jgi:hypothetical protein